MPLPLMLLLFPITSAIGRLITGVVIASSIYYFLKQVVQPASDRVSNAIISKLNDLSSVGGSAAEAVAYLDISNAAMILIATSTACLSIKMLSVAIRAFGINT